MLGVLFAFGRKIRRFLPFRSPGNLAHACSVAFHPNNIYVLQSCTQQYSSVQNSFVQDSPDCGHSIAKDCIIGSIALLPARPSLCSQRTRTPVYLRPPLLLPFLSPIAPWWSAKPCLIVSELVQACLTQSSLQSRRVCR